MNDTDAQTKGRSPDEVSPAATALKEARAVMTNVSEIMLRKISIPLSGRHICLDPMLGSISYTDISESPDGNTTFLERHRTNRVLIGVSRA